MAVDIYRWMEGHVKEYNADVAKQVVDCGRTLTTVTKTAAPKGATANLQRSINFTVNGEGANTYILFGAGATYSKFVEGGTKPHMPPVSALQRYVTQRGGGEGAAWAMAMAIAKKGTKPHPFFWPSVQSVMGSWRWHL